MTWEWLLWALPYAGLLACPVMMLWMMRGQRESGGAGDGRSEAGGAEGSSPPFADTEQEIARLKARLNHLEARRERRPEAGWKMCPYYKETNRFPRVRRANPGKPQTKG